MDTPILFRGSSASWSASGNNYLPLINGLPRSSSQGTIFSICSTAGTIKELRVNATTAPTPGNFTYTLYINGIASTLTCNMASGSTTASDLVNTPSVAAGDVLELKPQGAASAVLPGTLKGSVIFSSTASGESILLMDTSTGINTASAHYYSPQGSSGVATTTTSPVNAVMPTGGTISKFYVGLNGSPGAATGYTFTVYKNGSPTALTCTISDAATTGNDTSNSVSYSAGDTICIESTIAAGTPTSRILCASLKFVPTINGESLQLSLKSSYAGTATPTYLGIAIGGTGSESTMTLGGTVFTAKKLYLNLGTAPGLTQSTTVTFRNATADTALTTTVSGLSTAANDSSNTASVIVNDSIDIKLVSTAAPATSDLAASFVSYIAPAVTGTNSNMMMLGVG